MKKLLSALIVVVLCLMMSSEGAIAAGPVFGKSKMRRYDAEGFLIKERYIVLVEKDEDKELYKDFMYIKSARYNMEILSLRDIGISSKQTNKELWANEISEQIVEWLKTIIYEKKEDGTIDPFTFKPDKPKYLLLDDNIPRTSMNDGQYYSDYNYGFLWRWHTSYSSDIPWALNEKELSVIVSRMERSQLKYWKLDGKTKKHQGINAGFYFPIVAFRQKGKLDGGCPYSIMHIDHSYYGDYMRDIFKENSISVTTLYETRYSRLSSEVTQIIKPIKQPDLPLNKANFETSLKLSNLVLLGYTRERLKLKDGSLVFSVYRNDFTTASWNDKNKNYMAEDDEVEIEYLMKFSDFSKDNVKRFVFAPTAGTKANNTDFPISIRPKFDYDAAPNWTGILTNYQEHWDPEESGILLVWNMVLRGIAYGESFAEALLSGYDRFVLFMREHEKKDTHNQLPNVLPLFMFGPPDENISDLTQQPYLKADNIVVKDLESQKITIENLGELKLRYKIIDHSDNIEMELSKDTQVVEPMNKTEAKFRIKSPMFFLRHWPYTWWSIIGKLPAEKKTGYIVLETNDSFWNKIKINIEWYE